MAKSANRKLRELGRQQEQLQQKLEQVERERRELIAPMRTKMLNACDRALAAVLLEHLDIALSIKFAPADFESRIQATCLAFFEDRSNRARDAVAPNKSIEVEGIGLSDLAARVPSPSDEDI